MPKRSAGILMYRTYNQRLELFLVHPGGPFWARKDEGAWSIPKGEYSDDEDPLKAATREFEEETGFEAAGEMLELTAIKQQGGKIVRAWAVEGDCDATSIKSNTFSMEWPPRSGKSQEFPEIDKAEWFDVKGAKEKILKGQVGLIEELQFILKGR
jgi:predicted NUDIX family NTP pyrophosphohydrolase